jgi:DNA-binding CsgD family transcriptional regulator
MAVTNGICLASLRAFFTDRFGQDAWADFVAMFAATDATGTAAVEPDVVAGALLERACRIALAAQKWRLTPKQREVVELLVEGQTNKESASALGCQEGTVEVHVSRAMKKSGAGNRAGLVAKIWTNG